MTNGTGWRRDKVRQGGGIAGAMLRPTLPATERQIARLARQTRAQRGHMAHSFRTIALALSLLVTLSASAFAQGVGAIGGSVTDDSGAVLPGATVTLSNPGVIGGNQTAVTDGTGAYQ